MTNSIPSGFNNRNPNSTNKIPISCFFLPLPNSNLDKIVCYPATWFGKLSKNNTRDLFPNEWVKIN
jgi:hypothetical protein